MLFDQKPKFIRPALYYGRSLGGCSGHFSEKVISKSEDIITLTLFPGVHKKSTAV